MNTLRLALTIVFAIGCRYNFDPLTSTDGDAGSEAGADPDAIIPGDGPFACLTPMTSPTCTTTNTGVTLIGVGAEFGCAVRAMGLVCWGSNQSGQLGMCAGTTMLLSPTPSFGFDAVELALGEQHACIRLGNSEVWCWGSNFEGESGAGISATPDPVPHRLAGAWQSIATRRFHTCGVQTNGTLWCWGHNDDGSLGLGDVIDRGAPEQVGTDTTWSKVAVGGEHSCAIRTDGSTWCWGDNREGQLGDGTKMQRNVPTLVAGGVQFGEVLLGKQHTCGRTPGGSVYCWGRGDFGQLGNSKTGPTANELTPFALGSGPYNQLSVGWFHTCALTAGGELQCWGDNSFTSIAATATQYYSTPQSLGGTWVQVETGGYTTCLVSAFGDRVACFGINGNGQLGLGDTLLRSAPVDLCF